jgi:hypothetical protein
VATTKAKKGTGRPAVAFSKAASRRVVHNFIDPSSAKRCNVSLMYLLCDAAKVVKVTRTLKNEQPQRVQTFSKNHETVCVCLDISFEEEFLKAHISLGMS